MSEIPALRDECWPVDTGCCSGWDDYSAEVQARAEALAVQTLRALTGYQVGGCPIVLRPCSPRCVPSSIDWYGTGGTFRPHITGSGVWVNSCGCASDCSCSTVREIVLPDPVGAVIEVTVDGVPLPPTAYRVDNGNRLVRMDGEPWPACQEMGKPAGEVGTFTVEYLPAEPVDGLGAYAAGLLACEFAKACSGKKCTLPSGVTQIVRQGVNMTIASGAFTDGLTGIREVDAYITRFNPHGLKMASAVWSPDLKPGRITTWSH